MSKSTRKTDSTPSTQMATSANCKVYDLIDAEKFQQLGWRCATNETSFESDTLVGNWNEQRYDIKYIARNKPIPSQYSHYFETTNKCNFTTDKKVEELPAYVKLLGGTACEPRIFPRHQPELDPPSYKNDYNHYESTSKATYKDPRAELITKH